MKSILVDAGVWLFLCDERDSVLSRGDIESLFERIVLHKIVVPWPIAYETLRSSFVKKQIALERFEKELKSPNIVLLKDAPYREDAFEVCITTSLHRKRPLSMVDCLLRLLMEDVDVKIGVFATFNLRDFHDVCAKRNIEVLSDVQ